MVIMIKSESLAVLFKTHIIMDFIMIIIRLKGEKVVIPGDYC